MTRPQRPRSLRRTLLFAFGGLLTLAIGTQALFQTLGYPGAGQLGKIEVHQNEILKEMEVVSGLLSQRLRDWTREARADVENLAQSPLLLHSLETSNSTPLITKELDSYRHSHSSTLSLLLFEPSGRLRTSAGTEGLSLADLQIQDRQFGKLTRAGYRESINIQRVGEVFVLRIVRQLESLDRPGELVGLLMVDRALGQAVVSELWGNPTSWTPGWKCTVALRFEDEIYGVDDGLLGHANPNFRRYDSVFLPVDAALKGDKGPYIGLDTEGHTVLAYHQQVKLDSGLDLALVLAMDQNAALENVWDELGQYLLFWGVLLIGFMVLSIPLANQISRPLKSLTNAARRVGEGDLSVRVEPKGRSEINGFATVFNSMVNRLETYHQTMEILVAERTQQAFSLQRRQEALLFSIPDILMEVNNEKRYIWANQPGKEFFGDDVVGRMASDYFVGDQSDYSQGQPLFDGQSQLVYLESWQRRHDGEARLLAWRCQGLRDEHGQVTGTLSSARDITDQKKTEEALVLNQKMESIGVLAGGIAHDFNNLLGGIYGFLQLAQCKSSDSEISGYLTKATSTIQRTKALTSQLLTFSKGGDPHLQPELLGPALQEDVVFALSGTSVESHFHIADDLWPCLMDRNQIGQVINNIAINAHQAMPQGGEFTVVASNCPSTDHGKGSSDRFVRVTFTDTGPGIPLDVQKRIFEPFYSTKATGRGLGLASCYSIAHRHGGRMEVESTPGKGASFHLYLRATDLPREAAPPAPASPSLPGQGVYLVMDDEPQLAEIIAAILRQQGYQVILTTSGEEALETFQQYRAKGDSFRGVFADLTVHGSMGGSQLVVEIRKWDTKVPVYVVSGYADSPVMANPQAYGFTGSLTKPFLAEDLLQLLGTAGP